MTRHLGIDHPLIAVNDLDVAIEQFSRLGFTMAPKSKHPWGTSTCVAIMERSLIELVSIYDETLLDSHPAGEFTFGRFIRDHLAEREGIALTALHSVDADADEARARTRGVACQGTIKFGRDVVRADGEPDRTSTTLKIFADPEMSRLSNFACQQHRPDLIYVPKWSDHANGAERYSQITVMAAPSFHRAIRERLHRLFGEEALFEFTDGFGAETANGSYVVTDRVGVGRRYGQLPTCLEAEESPSPVAVHIYVPNIEQLATLLSSNDVKFRRETSELYVTQASDFGNVFICFSASGMRV